MSRFEACLDYTERFYLKDRMKGRGRLAGGGWQGIGDGEVTLWKAELAVGGLLSTT